jgi:hypothetical protein
VEILVHKRKAKSFDVFQSLNAVLESGLAIWVPTEPTNSVEAHQFNPEVYYGVAGEFSFLVIRYEDNDGIHYQATATHENSSLIVLTPDRCQELFKIAQRKSNLLSEVVAHN